jgi:hypothetical protein
MFVSSSVLRHILPLFLLDRIFLSTYVPTLDFLIKKECAMKWPQIDPQQTFEEVESAYGIKKEANDARPEQLGYHPSPSFYSKGEVDFSSAKLCRMRKVFVRAASRYRKTETTV